MTELRFGSVQVEVSRSIHDTGSRVLVKLTDDSDVCHSITLDLDPDDVHTLCREVVVYAWAIVKEKVGPILSLAKVFAKAEDDLPG